MCITIANAPAAMLPDLQTAFAIVWPVPLTVPTNATAPAGNVPVAVPLRTPANTRNQMAAWVRGYVLANA